MSVVTEYADQPEEIETHVPRQKPDGSPVIDTPSTMAMLALEAELDLVDGIRRNATGSVLSDAQTVAMLRTRADGPGLGTGNGKSDQ